MFRYMSSEEIEINHLKDLRMIHFYSLTADTNPIPAIAVIYGNNIQKNMSSLDPHYFDLLHRLIEVYKEEKDHRIIMDAHTKAVLDALCLAASDKKDNPLWERIKNDYESSEVLFSLESYSFSMISDMVTYLMTELYAIFDKKISFSLELHDWHGHGTLKAFEKTSELYFPYVMTRISCGEYLVYLGNFVEQNAKLSVRMVYTGTGVKLIYSSTELDLNGVSFYQLDLSEKVLKEEITISMKGRQIYVNERDLLPLSNAQRYAFWDEMKEDRLYELVSDQDYIVFQLPWTEWFIYSGVVSEQNQIKNKAIISMNYTKTPRASMLRARSYHQVESGVNALSLMQKQFEMEVYEKKSGKSQVQVYFPPLDFDTSGEYKGTFEGNYYMRREQEEINIIDTRGER